MEKFIKMQFNADLKNVLFSRAIVASFFIDEKVSLNVINEVKTIVSEAVTNARLHGCSGELRCKITANIVIMQHLCQKNAIKNRS